MPCADDRSGAAAAAALFLDRDGVVNVDTGYLHRIEECVFVDGVFELARGFAARGFLPVIVTNQSGIGRGYYDEAAMHAVHQALDAHLASAGAHIDAVYFAPHHEDAVIEHYRQADHPDRKPNPGMLLRAMQDFAIDRERSFLVGDKESDLEAARRAGVKGYLFEGGDLDTLVRKIVGG